MIRVAITPAQQRQAREGWIDLTPEQALSVRGKLTASAGAGRPRYAPRCPCGQMTVAVAERRNHRCLPQPGTT